MTEAEWLTGTDPEALTGALWHQELNQSRRKWALFGTACCRRVWHLLTDPRGRKAVEAAERLADGLAGEAEWLKAAEGAHDAGELHAFPEEPAGEDYDGDAVRYAHAAASYLTEDNFVAVHEAALFSRWASLSASHPDDPDAAYPEEGRQCDLLREIYGNPFRPMPVIDPAWLAWEGGTIPKLAQAIYEERAFDRLPVLADALEDAGCTDPDLLSHLRGPGPHARGCWAVDLLLGKE